MAQVKADPKAVAARHGHAHLDQQKMRRDKAAKERAAAWRKANVLWNPGWGSTMPWGV